MRSMKVSAADERDGYSLVELLIAIAMLGSVLLSVLTLFFMGRSNVYSGKQMTQGVSLATRVMEDLSTLTVPEVYDAFGIGYDPAGTVTPLATVDVDPTAVRPQDTYTRSVLRTTTSTSTALDPGLFLTRWRTEINQAGSTVTSDRDKKFSRGSVSIVLTPRNPDPPAAAVSFANATLLRIRVLVRWMESGRSRQVILDSVKTRRPTPP